MTERLTVADVVETTATARAYNVPAAVVASVGLALTDPQLADHHDNPLADKLMQGRVDLDDIMRITESSDVDGHELRGGDTGRAWAAKIIDGVTRELDRQRTDRLDRLDYDPENYAYVGITADNNEDLITQVVRFPREDSTLHRSEALTAAGWRPAVFDFTGEDQHTYGVGLDSDMLAFTASALIEDEVAGVLLAYGEPQCFLEEQPLLAAAPMTPPKDGNVYAIVDATDTTAVMDLILITPGPHIYRRNGGAWQLDKVLLESFMSPSPPPIVELTGATKRQIISQVDANSANQVIADEDGTATIGEGAEVIETKPAVKNPGVKPQKAMVDPKAPKPVGPEVSPGTPKPPENRPKRTPEDSEEGPNSKPPVTAAALQRDYDSCLTRVARLRNAAIDEATTRYYTDDGYASGQTLTAALASADAASRRRELTLRRLAATAAADSIAANRARIAELTNVVIPALTASAAQPGVHDSPGQRKAENLRKYWVHGEGAVKIRWGASGDWTRCYRQLSKYIGERAKGWCALRHKEMTGHWTGDPENK